jgi:hypothetical protein
MEKISGNAKAQVEFSIKFTLTKGEAQALDAIVGYGVEPFLKVFYEHMGKAYLQPHEKEMRKLFERVKNDLPCEVRKIEKAENAIYDALTEFKGA